MVLENGCEIILADILVQKKEARLLKKKSGSRDGFIHLKS